MIVEKNQLKSELEELVSVRKFTYIDACMELCNKYGVDAHTIASYIRRNSTLYKKIEKEALNLRLLKDEPVKNRKKEGANR